MAGENAEGVQPSHGDRKACLARAGHMPCGTRHGDAVALRARLPLPQSHRQLEHGAGLLRGSSEGTPFSGPDDIGRLHVRWDEHERGTVNKASAPAPLLGDTNP